MQPGGRAPWRAVAAFLCATLISCSALAAGVDPRAYRCVDLQALIAANGYVFLSQPAFGDFAVADVSHCASASITQLRSVPTRDNSQCPIRYCISPTREGPMQ
jgi:hypothetical protein